MSNEMSTSEAAAFLGVSPRTIQLWVDRGVLTAWKTSGGHRRISRDTVMACKKPVITQEATNQNLEKIIFAYQSIVDTANTIIGYEFFYRSCEDYSFNADDKFHATSSTIVGLLNQIGLSDSVGKSKCFINVDYEMLMDDVLLTLLPGRVVFEIPSDIKISDELLARCLFLKTLGYELLLDNYSVSSPVGINTDLFNFVKIDFSSSVNIKNVCGMIKNSTIIATRIESKECYLYARENCINFFQGRYFSYEKISSEKRLNPHRMVLLEVLALCVAQHTINEIEEKLKKEPALCISLLRLVNSTGIGAGRKIDSIRSALIMMGINGLQRWIQILLFSYSPQQTDALNPLQQAAFFRGRFLEKLAENISDCEDLKEKAFLVGMLSLADRLVQLPLSTIIEKLNLCSDISIALIDKKGKLGSLLLLAEALDQTIHENIHELLTSLNLTEEKLQLAFTESMQFSTSVNKF